jgi:hypothetical protein
LKGEEEDAGRDAPQTAWGKMPQPQRPVKGLGQDAPATSQDAPATTPVPLGTLPPLVATGGKSREPPGWVLWMEESSQIGRRCHGRILGGRN